MKLEDTVSRWSKTSFQTKKTRLFNFANYYTLELATNKGIQCSTDYHVLLRIYRALAIDHF